MSLTGAALLATASSYVAYLTLTFWYVVPALRDRSPASALVPLLWIHMFRYVALQLFSAQEFGLDASDAVRDEIAYGDFVGAVLALGSLFALRFRWRFTMVLVWIFVLATVIDLGNAFIQGVREDLFESATDVSWMILIFYVPALWISTALVAWQLLRARGEGLHQAQAA